MQIAHIWAAHKGMLDKANDGQQEVELFHLDSGIFDPWEDIIDDDRRPDDIDELKKTS